MKTWPFNLSGPDFLTVYTVAIVLAILAWLLMRERQRGAVRDRLREVPLDTYQLAYLRGGAVAAVESALVLLLSSGQVTRDGDRFAAGYRATAAEGAHELERAVLDAIATVPRRCRELVSRLQPELDRIGLLLVERGWLVPSGQRRRETMLAKMPLALVALVGVVRLFQGVHADAEVGFLAFELTVLATLLLVLPRLPRRTDRGDAALAHHRKHHDALVRTAAAAPRQLAPRELTLSYALAGHAIGAVAGEVLGNPRSRDLACGSSAANGCGCASSGTCSSGGGGGGGGCGGCGGCGGGGD